MILERKMPMNMRHLLTSMIFTGVLLFAASCRSFRIVDDIPPRNLTATRLVVTYNRIQDFWNQHRRVPTSPDELPDVKEKDGSMKDGWGRELNWESDGKTRVRVWSLGRDDKPGGAGEDADMEVEFVGKQQGQDELATIRTSDEPR
jgi:hypothetical protein